ncbi:PDC sensor domain-containing protein [Magnetococcales bacterium HHB-1]
MQFSLKRPTFWVIVLCMAMFTDAQASEVPEVIHKIAQEKLVPLGSDAILVKAVVAHNAKNLSLDMIKAMDAAWRAEPGLSQAMRGMIISPCGQRLKTIQVREGLFSEIFVMGNQGENVCMTDKTSDYWQGDEAKFVQSYQNGLGAVHTGKVAFDESTQAYQVQVSVPVKDNGTVIGAITFGVDIDEID